LEEIAWILSMQGRSRKRFASSGRTYIAAPNDVKEITVTCCDCSQRRLLGQTRPRFIGVQSDM